MKYGYPIFPNSIVVGQRWGNSERITLFIKLRAGLVLNEALQNQLKTLLRAQVSPRQISGKILQVIDLARTLNGKLAETAVTNIINNQPANNINTLANPAALQHSANREAS